MSRWILGILSAVIVCLPVMAVTEDPFKEFIGSYLVEESQCWLNSDIVPCSKVESPFNRVMIKLSNNDGHRVVKVTYYNKEAIILTDSYESFADKGSHGGNSWSTRAILSDTKPEWSKHNKTYNTVSNGTLVILLGETWNFKLDRLDDNKVQFHRGNHSYRQEIGGAGTIYPGETVGTKYILRRSDEP